MQVRPGGNAIMDASRAIAKRDEVIQRAPADFLAVMPEQQGSGAPEPLMGETTATGLEVPVDDTFQRRRDRDRAFLVALALYVQTFLAGTPDNRGSLQGTHLGRTQPGDQPEREHQQVTFRPWLTGLPGPRRDRDEQLLRGVLTTQG